MIIRNKNIFFDGKVKFLISFFKDIFEEVKLELEEFNIKILEEYEEFFLVEGFLKDMLLYLYKTQLASNVLLFYKKIFLDEDENINVLEEKNFFLKGSFKVKKVVGEKYYELPLGKFFSKNLSLEVEYKNPDNIIGFLQYKNIFFTGILLNFKELYKREYKVYSIPNSLNPNIAASILYFSNVKGDLLVLKCGDGLIPIEYYFKHYKDSVRKYEKEKLHLQFLKENFNVDESFLEEEDKNIEENFKDKIKIFCVDESTNYLQRAKQNSRLANAEKFISFSKNSLEFLILKFESKIKNVIVKHPFLSKHFSENKYKKYSYVLLEELNNIILEEGFLTVISNEFEEFKKVLEENKNFVLKKHKTIFRGDLELHFILLQKK